MVHQPDPLAGDATRRKRGQRKFSWTLERSLSNVPCLLDSAAAPCDVLPVSVALHRVCDDDLAPSTAMRHNSSAPADLALLCRNARRKHRLRQYAELWQVAWLVFLFVALDASKSLAVSWAATHGRMCAPLVICAKNVLSIAVGMAMAFILDGPGGLRGCLDVRRALRVLPIAGAFSAAQMCALRALHTFDPGSLKIIAQVNLPATALLSWLVLGRQYSLRKWLAIVLVLVSTMAFLQVRIIFFEPAQRGANIGGGEVDDGSRRSPEKILSMALFLIGIALSCLASIFAEMYLKDRYHIPFYIQKTNLMFGELLVAVSMVYYSSRGGPEACSWEQIHEWGQIPVVFVWLIHGWIGGLLVKRCSALVKNVSHILSALVTYFLPAMFAHAAGHSFPVTLSALLVLIAVLVFATVPQRTRDEHRGSRRSGPEAARRSQNKAEAAANQDCGNATSVKLARSASTGQLEKNQTAEHRKVGWKVTPLQAGELVTPLQAGEDDARRARFVDSVPGTASSLESTCSVDFLLLSFVLLDATKPLLVSWANQQRAPGERFLHGAFILVQTTLSLLVGWSIAVRPSVSLRPLQLQLHPAWRSRIGRCVDVRAVTKQLPCACCLCLSKLLLLMALSHLDAGTVRVFGQSSLPLVGVGSAVFLSKRYTVQQWCSLVAISVALVTFYYVKEEVRQKNHRLAILPGRGVDTTGVLLLLASTGFNCLGALIVEKFLKRDHGRLHQQKSQLLLAEVLVNGVLVVGMPLLVSDPVARAQVSPWHRGFFSGWDLRVWTCAVIWIPAGWITTMIVKRRSHLLKTIAQATSSVLTYIFTVVPLSSGPRQWSYLVSLLGPPLDPEPLSPAVVLLSLAVMLAALTFGLDRAKEGKAPKGAATWRPDDSYKALEAARPQENGGRQPSALQP